MAGHRGNPFCHVGDWVDHAAGFNRGLFLKGQARLTKRFDMTLAAMRYAVKRGEQVAKDIGYRLDDEAVELFIPEVLMVCQMLKCLLVFPLTKLIMDVHGNP